MPEPFEKPVETRQLPPEQLDVGENLAFQERWWKFEHAVWWFFLLLLAADIAGVFGRGPVAKAHAETSDGTISIRYERIQRALTSSTITVSFGPAAIHDNQAQLFISNSLVKKLGAERIAPEPANSSLGNDGITYKFPVTTLPASVDISLSPETPGVQHFTLQVPGAQPINATVVVMP